MDIIVIIDKIQVKIHNSQFGSIKETTMNLVTHCVDEALKIYKETITKEKQ